jgi:hypothetical protein
LLLYLGHFLFKISHRDFSAGAMMEFDLRFTDKEITTWGGMGMMKRLTLQHRH